MTMRRIFTSLLGDAKGRMIVVSAAVLTIGVVFYTLGKRGDTVSLEGAQVRTAGNPGRISSIPGQNPSESYNQLQAEANQQQAQQAIAEGRSAVATILHSAAESEPVEPAKKTEPEFDPQAEYQKALMQQQLLDAQLEAQRLRQQMMVGPAQAGVDMGDAQAMAKQAKALLGGWGPQPQVFVGGTYQQAAQTQAAEIASGQAAAANRAQTQAVAGNLPALINAGDTLFAVLDTQVNTDDGSRAPVLATIVQGQYKGAKLIGNVTRQSDKAVIRFSRITVPALGHTLNVNALAVDPDTARGALATDVDHHYMMRYGTLFASAFLEGLGKAIIPNQQYIIPFVSDANIEESIPRKLDGRDQALVALGEVGTKWGQRVNQFNIPPTVTVDAGTAVAVLFVSDVNFNNQTKAAVVANNSQPPLTPPSDTPQPMQDPTVAQASPQGVTNPQQLTIRAPTFNPAQAFGAQQ